MRGFRMLSLGLFVIGALSIGVFCGCEDDPDMDNVSEEFTDGNDAGGDRDSVNDITMAISPSDASLSTNGAVAIFIVKGADRSITWSVEYPAKGEIRTQNNTSATYERLSAAGGGDNIVIATDSRGDTAFATVSQP